MPLSLLVIIVGVHQQVVILSLITYHFNVGNSECPENYLISFNDLRSEIYHLGNCQGIYSSTSMLKGDAVV